MSHPFKLPQLRRYAQQLELDMARYDAEMADEVYLQDVSFGMQRLFHGVEAALRR